MVLNFCEPLDLRRIAIRIGQSVVVKTYTVNRSVCARSAKGQPASMGCVQYRKKGRGFCPRPPLTNLAP